MLPRKFVSISLFCGVCVVTAVTAFSKNGGGIKALNSGEIVKRNGENAAELREKKVARSKSKLFFWNGIGKKRKAKIEKEISRMGEKVDSNVLTRDRSSKKRSKVKSWLQWYYKYLTHGKGKNNRKKDARGSCRIGGACLSTPSANLPSKTCDSKDTKHFVRRVSGNDRNSQTLSSTISETEKTSNIQKDEKVRKNFTSYFKLKSKKKKSERVSGDDEVDIESGCSEYGSRNNRRKHSDSSGPKHNDSSESNKSKSGYFRKSKDSNSGSGKSGKNNILKKILNFGKSESRSRSRSRSGKMLEEGYRASSMKSKGELFQNMDSKFSERAEVFDINIFGNSVDGMPVSGFGNYYPNSSNNYSENGSIYSSSKGGSDSEKGMVTNVVRDLMVEKDAGRVAYTKKNPVVQRRSTGIVIKEISDSSFSSSSSATPPSSSANSRKTTRNNKTRQFAIYESSEILHDSNSTATTMENSFKNCSICIREESRKADDMSSCSSLDKNLNKSDKMAMTILHSAVQVSESVHNIAILLDCSEVNANARDGHCNTALHIIGRAHCRAKGKKAKNILDLLLSRGANVNAINVKNETPLDVATDEDVLIALIEAGAAFSTVKPKSKLLCDRLWYFNQFSIGKDETFDEYVMKVMETRVENSAFSYCTNLSDTVGKWLAVYEENHAFYSYRVLEKLFVKEKREVGSSELVDRETTILESFMREFTKDTHLETLPPEFIWHYLLPFRLKWKMRRFAWNLVLVSYKLDADEPNTEILAQDNYYRIKDEL